MYRFSVNLFLITFLTLNASAAENNLQIINQLSPNSVTIIGESHKHPESIALFQTLISDYLKQNKCLTVGLEINSNQQPVIDKVSQGRALVSAIKIPPMIDYPPYRKMIDNLVNLQRKGECLKLIAIDAGSDIDMRRDEWMAVKLAGQVGDRPMLVLLGNLHTLKKVDWDLSMTRPSPSVAEIMSSQGYRVKTYPQNGLDKNCDHPKYHSSRFIPANKPEALVLLNGSLISLINAYNSKTTTKVVDGFVAWSCGA